MEVVARLTASLLAQLRIVVGHEHTLVAVDNWGELDTAIRGRPIDVAVVDPRLDGSVQSEEIQTLLVQYPSLPVVLYTSLTPETLRVTVELARYGLPQVVLRGFDDEPQRFRALLEGQPARAVETGVLRRLASQLGKAPLPLARAIGEMFLAPHTFQSVDDLAAAATLSRRSLDRYLKKAGFAPARMLLTGARVARVYHYLRDPGFRIDDVTRKLAYPSPRLLARQVRAATGRTPSALRKTVEPEQFITELAAMLRRQGGNRDNGKHDRR